MSAQLVDPVGGLGGVVTRGSTKTFLIAPFSITARLTDQEIPIAKERISQARNLLLGSDERSPDATPSSKEPVLLNFIGPAGAGKTSLAREIAGWMDAPLLDTGKLWRYLGMIAKEKSLLPKGEEPLTQKSIREVCAMLDGLNIALSASRTHQVTHVYRREPSTNILVLKDGTLLKDGVDLERYLDTEEAATAASKLGRSSEIREAINERVRRVMQPFPLVVMTGRSADRALFRNPGFDIEVTADLDTRAARRAAKKLSTPSGNGLSSDEIVREVRNALLERDERDSKRPGGPIPAAAPGRLPDLLTFDTTRFTSPQAAAVSIAPQILICAERYRQHRQS